MKKTLSLILCICMLCSFGQVAFADEPILSEGSDSIKNVGLADETTLLKQYGYLENEASEENVFSPEEEIVNLNHLFEERYSSLENSGAEPTENFHELYEEYVGKNLINKDDVSLTNVDDVDDVELEPIGFELMGVSYYSGTSIPTYTSVTGWPLRNSYTSNGSVMYTYYYNLDDHFDYIEYLVTSCGWEWYKDSTSADGTYAVVYLVKGSDVIGIFADFVYLETQIVFTQPTTVSPTSISLNTSKRTMIVGNEYTLKATISPSNATSQTVTWSSSASSVASVSSSGVVTAKSAGSATITAKTSNGKTATCSITVKSLVLDYYPDTKIPTFTCITGISLKNSTKNDDGMVYLYDLDTESHTDYEAYLVNEDGWVILYEELESDNSAFSALYGKGDVTVLVIADFVNDLTGIVFEIPKTTVEATGVTLNKTSSKMTIGNEMTLTATIAPSNATEKNITWSSSNTSVATVSSSGVVTAKAAGSATITAKTSNGKTATCEIVVESNSSLPDDTTHLKGDILQDGKVNAKDAVKLAQYLARWDITLTDSEKEASDVVADGVVNAKDAVKLAQYLAKWDITLE